MVIKPVISSVVRGVVRDDSVQRYFTELDGNGYYQFSQPITLSSDFELEINGEVFDTVSSNQSFVGGSGGGSPAAGAFTMYQSSTISRNISVQLPRAGTSAAYLVLPALPSSGFYKIVLKRVGTTVTVSSGAISNSYTDAGNITSYEISFLARWSTSLYKSGFLSDLKIWTNGDRNTGTLIVDSPIDEAAGVNTIANLANPANPLVRVNQPLSATELYTLNTSTTPDQWENEDQTKIIPIAPQVVAPPVSTLLASYSSSTGNVYAGTTAATMPPIANFEWIPQTGGDSNVLSASFAQLPVSSAGIPNFHKVMGVDPVADITAELLANGFDPVTKDYGSGKVRGSITAWVGMVNNPATNIAYIPWGGGHNDSSLNGIWAFDANKMSWFIEDMPSDPDAVGFEWSQPYKDRVTNSFTIYTSDGVDRLYELPDGRPPSMHTYNGVWLEGNTIVTCRNRRYEYDLGTQQYAISQWTREGVDVEPNINHWVTKNAAGDAVGIVRRPNVYGGMSKVAPSQSVLQAVGTGLASNSGIYWSGSTAATAIDDNKYLIINNDLLYGNGQICVEYDMTTDTYGTPTPITGAVPNYPTTDEMQVALYIAEWGARGSVLRQHMHGTNKGEWYLLDVATKSQTLITPTGYATVVGNWVGSKCYTVEKFGMKFIIYVSVSSTSSEVYIARIS